MSDPTSEYRAERLIVAVCPECFNDLPEELGAVCPFCSAPLAQPQENELAREQERRMKVEAAYAALGGDCCDLALENARLREELAAAREQAGREFKASMKLAAQADRLQP